jgi:hypothetical protein
MTENTQERIKRMTEDVLGEVTQKMGFTESPFRCRCDPQPSENGRTRWRVALWVTPFQGLGFEIEAREETTDAAMRLRIEKEIEKELTRAGFEE